MLQDFRRLDRKEIDADLCIVGGGAAGITLARAFTGTGIRVCLLESGGFEYEPKIQELYNGEDAGFREPYGLTGSRLRYFGGTTNHWTGHCAPLSRMDFEARPWLPHSGWPIRIEDLDPYYKVAQTLCEVGSYRYHLSDFPERLRQAPPFDGHKVLMRVWRLSPPTRFGTKYRRELEQAGNVHVYLHANVTELEANRESSCVSAARLRTLDGQTGRVRAKYFVLACGGIENARILLLSNRVASRGLGNGYDLVGRFYMDHPKVESAAIAFVEDTEPFKALLGDFSKDSVKLETLLCASEESQKREQTLNWAAQLSFAPVPGEWAVALRDIRDSWQAGRWPDDFSQKVWAVISDLDSVAKGIYQRFGPRPLSILARLEPAPDPNNRITLAQERDALGQNMVRRYWRLAMPEKRTVRSAMRILAEELGRLGLGRVKLADWLPGENVEWSDNLSGGPHHIGTTRMASNPRKGVVDATCRVHGMDNLYIAGSSVFPTAGYAHPTLTIVALALRLAEQLKQRLQRKTRAGDVSLEPKT